MKAVLFDIDNTLLIKRPTNAEKWHEVLVERGCTVSLDAAQRAFAACEIWVGRQRRREIESGIRLNEEEFLSGVMKCCIDSLGIDESHTDALKRVWMGDYEKNHAVMHGTVELLEYLKNQKMLLGIVSNNTSQIRKVLDDADLTKYFQTIVISDEVGILKPDPKILLLACEHLGVLPEETLYVGDHPFDVVCARDASMKSAWIPINEYMMLPENVSDPEICLKNLGGLIEWIAAGCTV